MIIKAPSLNSIVGRLRFKQLAFLVALSEGGSLHRAAHQLSMTQPGATKMLQEIESTFGAQLFVRSQKGVQTNELGRCAVRYARLAQADLGHLCDEFASVLTGKGGRLRVGAIGGALPALVIPALTRLHQSQPSLSVSLTEDTSAGLLSLLDAGRLDVAVCRITVATEPDRYSFEALWDERVAVVVGPQHPLAKSPQVTLGQLAALNWVLYPSLMPLRTILEREFKEAGLQLPQYTTETSSVFVTMLLLQESTNFVALLTAENAEFCEKYHLAHKLPLDIRCKTEPYGAVLRRDTVLSPAGKLMMDALRDEASLRLNLIA